ncbi:hypothetical protein DUI87_10633 [Hirundo rustica rustica]|uniref:Uncharacterized protein n=1 Tax=Hirundo rustica rustica TaxID=333673 RepID=A0A3M0KIN9_HIRRU|nr:hypothetical protein DUI87_10633 [Hirundo rustica rustica]
MIYFLYVTPSVKIRSFTQVYKVEELPAVLSMISSSGVKGLVGVKLVPRLFNAKYLEYSELAYLITAFILLICASKWPLSSFDGCTNLKFMPPITNLQTHRCSFTQELNSDTQIDIIRDPNINRGIQWQLLFPRSIDAISINSEKCLMTSSELGWFV